MARGISRLGGNCWDNAVTESFFHTLKVEAIHDETFETRRKQETVVFVYIERYYNRKGRHSTIEYLSPELYEQKYKVNLEM